MKAFVISLTSAVKRRAHINAMLADNIPFEIIDAISGKGIEDIVEHYAGDQYCPRAMRHLTLNEVACSLSHGKALSAFLETSYSHGLILEDDAHIDREHFNKIEDVLAACPPFDLLKIGGGGQLSTYGMPVAKVHGVSVVSTIFPSVCSYAYIVSRDGAAKLAGGLLPIRDPYDAYIRNVHDHKCKIFEISPWLALPAEQADRSTIGGIRESRRIASTPWQNIRSAAFRARYWLMTRLFFVQHFGWGYLTPSAHRLAGKAGTRSESKSNVQ